MSSGINFLGIPVEGDINQVRRSHFTQRPAEELGPLIQAVFADDTVKAVRWRQYTPYFNDGDACTFSVYGLWVRTDADQDVDDEYELELDGTHNSLGDEPHVKVPADGIGATNGWKWEKGPYQGPDKARYDRCHALRHAIEGGAFEHVLLDAFGDHAAITVRKTGIEVEFYNHD